MHDDHSHSAYVLQWHLWQGKISKTMLYMVKFWYTRIYECELQWWTVLVLSSVVCKKCLWMCTRVTLWCIPYAMQYYMMNDGLTVKVCYWWLWCPKLHIQMKWIQYWMNNAYSAMLYMRWYLLMIIRLGWCPSSSYTNSNVYARCICDVQELMDRMICW